MDSREEHPMRFGFRCKIVGVENNGVFIGIDGNTSPLTRDPGRSGHYSYETELVIDFQIPAQFLVLFQSSQVTFLSRVPP